MIRTSTLCLVALGAAGCATVQIPTDRLERNEASIRGAAEMGAEGVPAARLHLQMAKDETVMAKRLASKGDERATGYLQRAEADAELALGLAREVSVHAEAVRAGEDLKAVQARGTP